MTFQDKINLLKTKAGEIGCSERVLLPPLYRVQLAFGSESPPPLFLSFAHNAFVYGTFFCLFWSGTMLATAWQIHPIPIPIFIFCAMMLGMIFGMVVASNLQRRKKGLGIGSWEEFCASCVANQEAENVIALNQP